ncbi:MAG: tripartite tricarboxylate transporter substrate binding protein, partial [Hyphomicrobium sp.]|nr:tripartite tricarboxylate transporter substrate binding protein [Hyphomicrobium sp.]
MMQKRNWKILFATTLCAMGALVLAASDAAAADNYPAKPIKIVVPYTPGGGADILTRTLAA